MAYQTGSFTDPTNLLELLVTFATGNGWTLNGTVTTDGTGKRAHLQNSSGAFCNFRSMISETPAPILSANQTSSLLMYGSTGYNSANNWYQQPGYPNWLSSGTSGSTIYNIVSMTQLSVTGTYHFFAFSGSGYDVIYCIVESPAGVYKYLMFGTLNKASAGTYTGGQFYIGNNYYQNNTHITTTMHFFGTSPNDWSNVGGISRSYGGALVDHNGYNGWRVSLTNFINTVGTPRLTDSIVGYSSLWKLTPNSINDLSPILPINIYTFNDGVNATFNTPVVNLGQLPELYWLNIKNLNPAQTISNISNSGSDTFKVFPFSSKSLVSNGSSSFIFGFAIKNN